MRRFLLALLIAAAGVFVLPQAAQAHVERPSYWPDPNPDCSVTPCAGGKVPDVRSLASAVDDNLPGETRVVCKPDSMTRLQAAVAAAVANGWTIRPTEKRTLTQSQGDALLAVNQQLFSRCAYDEIQAAVTASGNNDRVVVMPGLYTEDTSRAQPTYDPACDAYETHSDSGDPGAPSHKYQYYCPNDANLIAVIGRGLGEADAPDPALADRHGIPEPGPCIRCNLQLEGSGVSADDVVVEAGDTAAGDGGPSAAGHKKDVGVFVDRADGFVLRNMKIRHAREHGIYVLETDGYVLEQFKTFYNGAYGVLTFVGDHGLVQRCEAAGSGDSGLYPGSGAPTLVNRDKSFYPEARTSQTFQFCDMHHNTGGFSGTNSHGTLVQNNNFYDNALGFTTDVFTAAGHPGFPQEGNIVQNNNFYSNNFNPFAAGSEVVPFIPAPVGTGLWLAGGNSNVVRGNSFWDNWRRGLMLFAVPDAMVCSPLLGGKTPDVVPGCNPLTVSTSYNNRFYDNTMGVSPSGEVKPNGRDFWWDSFPLNTGNCWWDNHAAPGKKLRNSPGLLPNCFDGKLPLLSIGLGNVFNEAELVACFAGFELSGYPNGNDFVCNWAKTPKQPSSATLTTSDVDDQALADRQKQVFSEYCSMTVGSRTCQPYDGSLGTATLLRTLLRPLVWKNVDTVQPAESAERLGAYTCSWWRQADDGHKLGMVQRIRHFVGGKVQGDETVGYGTVLRDGAAVRMLDNRCSTGYAGGFALYKLYGAAAAFASANG
ncbi:MAG: right-handed parallel beta-helix repeat-containing protein [Nocardioidaceae bacterium]|nr:right-handed parallel beta-helix repeat-containing protein [Nocardioidaceae bacterium]